MAYLRVHTAYLRATDGGKRCDLAVHQDSGTVARDVPAEQVPVLGILRQLGWASLSSARKNGLPAGI